jgi:cytochrome c peroxidase
MKFLSLLSCSAVAQGVATQIPTADVSKVNWNAVRSDIREIMNTPSWDDGSYAPFFIRLAWHSSGTYDKSDGTGGSNGATMRFSPESDDPNNGGLDQARAKLEPIYEKHAHTGLTHADLWILASYVGLEMTAGPTIEFVGGRVDKTAKDAVSGRLPNPEEGLEDGLNVDSENRLAGWEKLAAHIRSVFGRMGFNNDAEIVALVAGGHSYGRCHRNFTGYEGPWQDNAIYFANEYVTDMLGDDWRAVNDTTPVPEGFPKNHGYAPDDVRPKTAFRQYIDITTIDPNNPGFLQGMRSDDSDVDAEFTPGEYIVDTTWMNVRQAADPSSPYLARAPTNTTFTVVELQNVSSSVRGLTLEGGWITVNKGDPLYIRKLRNLDSSAMRGKYRIKSSGEEVTCRKVYIKESGLVCQTTSPSKAIPVYTPTDGVLLERIRAEYNDQGSRVPLKDTYGHQMMLVSDMVFKWDPGFRKYMDIYNDDEDLLRNDFSKQFKRLTELGTSWSSDRPDAVLV